MGGGRWEQTPQPEKPPQPANPYHVSVHSPSMDKEAWNAFAGVLAQGARWIDDHSVADDFVEAVATTAIADSGFDDD